MLTEAADLQILPLLREWTVRSPGALDGPGSGSRTARPRTQWPSPWWPTQAS